MSLSAESAVLTSWKDIARYLGKGVRTVQRWERHHGLPVRRPTGASQKSAVVLHRDDVDAWLSTHFSPRRMEEDDGTHRRQSNISVRAELRENMQKARDLRTAHEKLANQISESITLLSQRCARLTEQSLQAPWRPSLPLESMFSGPSLVESVSTDRIA